MSEVINGVPITVSGINTFPELTDTPANYSGGAGKVAKVKATEDGIEFGTAGAATLNELTDVELASPADEQVLTYESSSSKWKNKAAAGVGFDSRCSVGRSGDQAIPVSTYTKVQLNSETYDNDNEFDSATLYRFTATVAGYYHVSADIRYRSLASGKRIFVIIRRNGANFKWGENSHAGGATEAANVVGDAYLDAGDYLELWTYTDEADNVNGTVVMTYMDIHRFA